MVIVNTNAGNQWFKGSSKCTPEDPCGGGYPVGGSEVPVGRYVIENGKIEAEVLSGAPMPKGHEDEAMLHYKCLLSYYLNPINSFRIRTLPDYNPLGNLSPERDPEAFLKNLWRVYSGLSEYMDFEEEDYRPILDSE